MRRNYRVSRVVAFLGLALAWPLAAFADYTSLSGTLDENLVLESGKTYHVYQTLTVPEQITLTIQPGAIVKLKKSIYVHGVLDVQGDDSEAAVLTVAKDHSVGAPIPGANIIGASILFSSSAQSLISQAEIRNLKVSVARSKVDFSDVHFANVTGSPFGGIRGALTPNITVKNVSFGPSAGYAGYYVNEHSISGHESMPNLGIPYLIDGSVEIAGNASLDIEAGVVVKMKGGVVVHGALNIDGEVGNEVIFSGPNDNRHGGAVNTGFGGSFSGIDFWQTSHSSMIRHTTFALTGTSTQALEFVGASPTVEHVLIDTLGRGNSTGSALIYARDEAQPVISCSIIRTTDTGSFYGLVNDNVLAEVDAKELYWDHPLGPTMPGDSSTKGAEVKGNVNVQPFRSSPDDPCSIDPPSSLLLDIDGDGEVNPVIDGVLITRYTSGLRGQDLVSGLVIPGGAARRDVAEIETYLDWMVTRSAR